MSKEEKSKRPLLYISQPDIQPPEKHMQTQFTYHGQTIMPPREENIQESPDKLKESKGRKKHAQSSNEEDMYIFESEKEPLEEEAPVAEVSTPTKANGAEGRLRPVKSFPSMTTNEKIDHLSRMPRFYYCEFLLEKERVLGKIHENLDETIVVETVEGEYYSVAKTEILGIRIVN